uniref:Uncharacterized protein n=1 Tax=Siphoviridae sp. ctMRT7 TaxID=2827855 RepID=A0A8S5SSJ1_9CAUD|nr:MAG TPA: hypothetical protein [Siphoviridae sp. ctMRT7]
MSFLFMQNSVKRLFKIIGHCLPPPAQKIKEEKQNEFLIYAKFREETV